MTKELQDLAWSVLPKEFKVEVKDDYKELVSVLDYFQNKISLNNEECDRCDLIREKRAIYNKYFGHHNLTSDAEGEEMLTVSAITVREMYAANERIKTDASDNELGLTSDHINHVLRCLFGSKCLPDEEPKSCGELLDKMNGIADKILDATEPKAAEPKFKMDEQRLNIATKIAQGMLAAREDYSGDCTFIVKKSFEIADALIAGCKKE